MVAWPYFTKRDKRYVEFLNNKMRTQHCNSAECITDIDMGIRRTVKSVIVQEGGV